MSEFWVNNLRFFRCFTPGRCFIGLYFQAFPIFYNEYFDHIDLLNFLRKVIFGVLEIGYSQIQKAFICYFQFPKFLAHSLIFILLCYPLRIHMNCYGNQPLPHCPHLSNLPLFLSVLLSFPRPHLKNISNDYHC